MAIHCGPALCATGGAFLLALTAPAHATLVDYRFQATYEVEHVEEECFIGNCSDLEYGIQVGDLWSMTYILQVDTASSTFSATAAGPVVGFDSNESGIFHPVFDISNSGVSFFQDSLVENFDPPVVDESYSGSIVSSQIELDGYAGPFTPEAFNNAVTGGNLVWGGGEFFGIEDGDSDVEYFLEYSLLMAANLRTLDIRTASGNNGLSQDTPLLPDNPVDSNDPIFVFTLSVDDIDLDIPIWLDPPMAVGYTYDIDGAEIAEIVAPDFDTVPDSDGYVIVIDNVEYALAVGATLDLHGLGLTGVTAFTLLGIDPELALDPGNQMAFPLAIVPANFQGNDVVRIAQAPVVSSVPLPAGGWLLLAGLAAMVGARRQRRS